MDSTQSFEKAMEELESIVNTLERGQLSLDESIEMFQKGIKLSAYCSTKLNQLEKKINIILEKENGEFVEHEFAFKEE